MQCHDDGSLFHIWIILNGHYRTSTSSTTHSFEVCKSLKEIYITFRLSRGCALGRIWLRPQPHLAPRVKVKVKRCHILVVVCDCVRQITELAGATRTTKDSWRLQWRRRLPILRRQNFSTRALLTWMKWAIFRDATISLTELVEIYLFILWILI